MSKRLIFLTPLVATVAVLSACGTTESAAPPPPAPVQAPQPQPDPEPPAPVSLAERLETEPTAVTSSSNENLTSIERRFAEGLNQYNDGNYAAAIRIFREPVFSRSWPELQVRALKYLAFSYCVTNNVSACRRTFVQLFKVNPDFELSDAESGHPIWGPAFKQAKADYSRTAK